MKRTVYLFFSLSLLVWVAACEPGSGTRVEICDNGVDDDGDRYIDCADINCIGLPGDADGHLCQAVEENCSDGFDNDADGMTDLEDPDCSGMQEICANGLDDDGDGDIDCDDSDCADDPLCIVAEVCDNGSDDDGDGDIDCADADCIGDSACPAVEDCSNGVDDDGDGDTDCDDSECVEDPSCVTGEICDNGSDDDGDSLADCADPECDGEAGPGGGTCEATETSCGDGYDNDGDGAADCDDTDCDGDSACVVVEVCNNGTDDDGDGLADCLDPDCDGQAGLGGGTCETVETSCGDSYDNDGDGSVDCDDPDCAQSCLAAGDLVITELLKDPNALADSEGEWFEVYNASAVDLDLRGLIIFSSATSGEETHTIAAAQPVTVAAGGYIVLGPQGSQSANPQVPVSYEYSQITLDNAADSLGLRTAGGMVIDAIAYDEVDYHDQSGMSHSLDRDNLTAAANDVAANWCWVTTQFNGVDYGTPGAANPSCTRESLCDDGVDNDQNGVTDCADFACAQDPSCTTAQIPGQGDLVVTEIMANPGAGAQTWDYEWFEIHNPTASAMELNGLRVCDIQYSQHCFFLNLGTSTPLAAGGYAVLASDGANVSGATVLWSYGASIQLGNASDGIVLMGGEEGSEIFIDMVAYDSGSGWPVVSGASMQLSAHLTPDFTVNDVAANWCESTTEYDAVNGLFGTPGQPNLSCAGTFEVCDNGSDDDGDGLIDCADPDCSGQTGTLGELCESPEVSCADGYDNDGDGLVDDLDPDCGAGFGAQLYIWEVDSDTLGTDVDEFVEVWNNTGTTVDFSTEKYFLLLINGSTLAVYEAVQLTGTLAQDEVLVVGSSTVPNVDIVAWTSNLLQNGADGVILVRCDDCDDNASAEWPSTTVLSASASLTSALTSSDATRIDGIAYDTSDADIADLMSYCGVTTQWNENQNGSGDTESNYRVDPVTWAVGAPTPGVK